jgi:DNA-binding CsgD family transcriptional regulator
MVSCEAWQLLGVIAREHDLDEASRCFDRARHLAEEHNLPIQRIYALVRVAGNDWLRHGTTSGLERAHEEALRVGAITVAYNVDAIVALQSVLCGDYILAGQQIDACLEATNRLQLGGLTRYVLMTKATLAAHKGKRAEMEDAVTAFLAGARGGLPELPLCFGLARAFCALLEENRDLAESELAKALAYESENPTTFHLSGRHGLHLLLGVLAGRAGWPHHAEITATSPSTMRWNHHFVLLAHAVLLGRDGRHAEALIAFEEAQAVASQYPMARHLGLRLVATSAHDDGWGEPVTWLRAAEEHFHQAGVGAVASACRGLLRQVGVPVQQRRSGTDQVPRALRASGVTAREYEVFVLLAERMGNKAIATRLHISPRTVEKHVASLIAKTGTPDREALSTYAASS